MGSSQRGFLLPLKGTSSRLSRPLSPPLLVSIASQLAKRMPLRMFAGGNVTLNSTDPFDAPIINPNLLGTDVDVAVMREAVKAARSFVAAPAWSDYIISEFGAFAEARTDEELDAYIRNNTDTVDHPVGTVAMGKGAQGALDSELKVKGTIGLRVVDASAFVRSLSPRLAYSLADHGHDSRSFHLDILKARRMFSRSARPR